MKRYLLVLLTLLAFVVVPASALEWRWAPKTDFRSPDKFSHFLAGNYLTAEFSQWRFAGGNRWTGFLTMSGAMGLWEIKDGIVDYETYGRFGAEGFDPRDIVMNELGGLYGVRLHDQFLVWVGLKESVEYESPSGYCEKPISELLPVIRRRVLIGVSYVTACAAYNMVTQGEYFPHRGKFYQNPRKAGFLETLNSESSFIIPWVTNSELREYAPLYIRYPSMIAMVFAFEEANGLWDDRDVPWFGDRNGYQEGDVWTGVISTQLAVIYEWLFWDKEAVCKPWYSLGPTPDGFGLIKESQKSSWTLSAALPDNGGINFGFRINF